MPRGRRCAYIPTRTRTRTRTRTPAPTPAPTPTPRQVLGGTYSAADVAWSEIQAAPDFHELLLFAPSICGARLLGETAGWWLALVRVRVRVS